MSYYETDPGDPDAPVALTEYHGIRVGDMVDYHNPLAPPLPGGPFRVEALYRFADPGGDVVQAVLNGGELEVSAANLRLAARCRHCPQWITELPGQPGVWVDEAGFAACAKGPVLHQPLPEVAP